MLDRKTATLERALEMAARDDTYVTAETVTRWLETGEWGLETPIDRLEHWARVQPDKVMIRDQAGNETTYREFRDLAWAFGAGLLDLGIRPGEVVAIQLPNWREHLIATTGAMRVGIIPTFATMAYRLHELDHLFRVMEPVAWITVDEMRGFSFLGLWPELRARIPSLRAVITARAPQHEGARRLEDLVAAGASRIGALPEPPLSSDICMVMPTSGTTGRPKGVMHTHASLTRGIENFLVDCGWSRDDHWIVITPFSHFMAMAMNFLWGCLHDGGSMTIADGWDSAKMVDLIERDGVTHFIGAPPMLVGLLREPTLDPARVTSLKQVLYGGAPCPIEVLRQLGSRLQHAQFVALYGSSEMLGATCTRPGDPLEIAATTVGRPVTGFHVRVVDENGDEVAPGVQGELWGQGSSSAIGYYRDPEGTRERFIDGWFHSKDVVTVGADGNFRYAARLDDMINRGAFKIDPREVEELLYLHPKVGQAVVVGVKDQLLGQRVFAHVVPKVAGDPPTIDELRALLEEQGVAKPKWPEGLILHDQLPTTPSGKVMRYELRAMEGAAGA